MELTQEQQSIINSTGDIKINAVAGSGKTTTVIEYARTRPANSRILYLAFNKSVKIEAQQKFTSRGLQKVKVETAHSLAFRHIVPKSNYKVKANGYKTFEICEILGLKSTGEPLTEYVVANHINKMVAYFCNSNKAKVRDLNYLDIVTESKAKAFAKTYYKYIEQETRRFLAMMDKGEIEITHDFYLKKFQLSAPRLYFDYILFDEGQDASPAMLDVFIRQQATKVIVGDTHQQIYGWRHAVNSLEKTDFKTYHLSTSFRFRQDIANLGMETLSMKNLISDFEPPQITGAGQSKDKKTKAILARTNLGLLLKAIEYNTENWNIKGIYFEGNINSYTYAEDGASLYDILNLSNGKRHLIRDKLIKKMKTVDELREYITKTEDPQLGLMMEIVKEYGNDIHSILKEIKSKHVGNENRHKADMIFSTVHRCKGMEYDSVELINDFINKEKIESLLKGKEKTKPDLAKLNEEINLLYVAITRTRNELHIPSTLIPDDFPVSPNIHPILEQPAEDFATEEDWDVDELLWNMDKKQTYMDRVRETHKEAYQRWTSELDNELTVMFCAEVTTAQMAKHFGRTKGAIRARIKKLELESLYG